VTIVSTTPQDDNVVNANHSSTITHPETSGIGMLVGPVGVILLDLSMEESVKAEQIHSMTWWLDDVFVNASWRVSVVMSVVMATGT